ncbi:hypothetical protein [Mesobacillus selenatarsenatis]|uniref:Uncharacterized protein n=1 Tax=Mesobacillus selenatarsenatis (strain DSM 18680 / JCM 14380 / FERM P-15431 / SF-1) TaxID=1321606 RepID=A0A0A8WZ04_MESS1|nr:hypothetical protein [Mesobacillus selenatarsenatis]GAM11967.1 hypothetical protein SAMD00020551_0085 [Mesobacillus selenatarsenatis SF-1]
MCVSNNAIELQAYRFSEKIQESSSYNIVRVDFIGGTFLKCDQGISLRDEVQDIANLPLIKNLILQTKSGKQFCVEPDELGLRFAEGELSYRQYLLAKKQKSRQMLYYTFGSTGLFTALAWAFGSYFF